MSSCTSCAKTAFPIESIKLGKYSWHKGCFKCSICGLTLTLKNVTCKDDVLFCTNHAPKDVPTAVVDAVATRHAVLSQNGNTDGKIAKLHRSSGVEPGLCDEALQNGDADAVDNGEQ